jgi:hypothetical protein
MIGFLAALVRRLARIGGALRPTFGPEAGDRPCPECNHPMRDDGIDRAGDRHWRCTACSVHRIEPR